MKSLEMHLDNVRQCLISMFFKRKLAKINSEYYTLLKVGVLRDHSVCLKRFTIVDG